MNRKSQSIITLVLVVISFTMSSVVMLKTIDENQKVGYVDNTQLLIKYKGYSEAQDEYKLKEQKWQANIETMEEDLKQAFIMFQSKKSTLEVGEIRKEEQILEYKKNHFLESKEKYASNILAENERLMGVVSNQIESYINIYAKENGYDLIVGISEQGNVLYSDINKNITEKLLIDLNASYEGI